MGQSRVQFPIQTGILHQNLWNPSWDTPEPVVRSNCIQRCDMFPCCIHESNSLNILLITDIVSGSFGCDVIHTMWGYINSISWFHARCSDTVFPLSLRWKMPRRWFRLKLVCRQRKKKHMGREISVALRILVRRPLEPKCCNVCIEFFH